MKTLIQKLYVASTALGGYYQSLLPQLSTNLLRIRRTCRGTWHSTAIHIVHSVNAVALGNAREPIRVREGGVRRWLRDKLPRSGKNRTLSRLFLSYKYSISLFYSYLLEVWLQIDGLAEENGGLNGGNVEDDPTRFISSRFTCQMVMG